VALRKALAGGLLALGVFALPAPLLAQVASEGPSPATVAMRWQWLNPQINSFTFRETGQVFESRPVNSRGPRFELPDGPPMAMPAIQFDGRTRSYDEFAEDTFTNALLVIRDGRVVFEDYRNRSDAPTRFIGFSMSAVHIVRLSAARKFHMKADRCCR
jgi:hypothetical protein